MMRYDSHWVQLGVVSFGNKCGEPGYPGKLFYRNALWNNSAKFVYLFQVSTLVSLNIWTGYAITRRTDRHPDPDPNHLSRNCSLGLGTH